MSFSRKLFCMGFMLLAAPALAGPGWLANARGDQPRLKSIYCEEHTLEEFVEPDATAVVLVFMGIECPVVRQYVPRLNELFHEHESRGVRFLAVFSNAGDHVAAIARYSEQSELAFPVYLDREHRLADQLGVEMMSEVVVLNHSLEKVYQGAIDNQFKKRGKLASAAENYLADVLRQLTSNLAVARSFMPASGCRIERNDPLKADSTLTYCKDIAPLIQKHCQSCHRPGEVGPFELLSYADVCNHSETIEEVVLDRRMPPWHGELNETFGKLRNDKRLTDDEVQTIVAWIRGGAAKGDPAIAPRPVNWPSPGAWSIGKPDFVYQMTKPFTVPATGVINYQFFRVSMNMKTDCWVQAIEVRPGNREVVHHIGLHIAPAGDADFSGLGMAALFGLSGDRSQPLNDYVPGDLCNHKEYPPGRAVRIPKGSDLIFEVHYTPNGKAAPDQSKVAIRWASGAPAEEVHTQVFRKKRGGFRIPAGNPHYRMEDTYYFERDVLLDSIRPHLHARAKSYRLELIERDPTTDEVTHRETVLTVPIFDMNWQRTYELETPLLIPAGSELVATAYFDNSRFNPNNPDPTTDVFWGLQSSDEMFSTRVQYRLPK